MKNRRENGKVRLRAARIVPVIADESHISDDVKPVEPRLPEAAVECVGLDPLRSHLSFARQDRSRSLQSHDPTLRQGLMPNKAAAGTPPPLCCDPHLTRSKECTLAQALSRFSVIFAIACSHSYGVIAGFVQKFEFRAEWLSTKSGLSGGGLAT